MRMFAYDIYEPIGRKDEDTFPVIFALHGFGGDELEMAGRLELLMDRFVVVSMRGDVEYGPAYGFYHMVTEGDPNPQEVDYISLRSHNLLIKFVRITFQLIKNKFFLQDLIKAQF